MSLFEGMSIPTSKSVLDYLSSRQKVVGSNVANIDTPGYKTRDVEFKNLFKEQAEQAGMQLKATHPKHFAQALDTEGAFETFYAYEPVNKHDGVNDVDIDKEMLKLGEIQASFNIFSEILRGKYHQIQRLL